MPLKSGYSQETIGKNIGTEIRHGHDPRQAAAIAYAQARKTGGKKAPPAPEGHAEGGMIQHPHGSHTHHAHEHESHMHHHAADGGEVHVHHYAHGGVVHHVHGGRVMQHSENPLGEDAGGQTSQDMYTRLANQMGKGE